MFLNEPTLLTKIVSQRNAFVHCSKGRFAHEPLMSHINISSLFTSHTMSNKSLLPLTGRKLIFLRQTSILCILESMCASSNRKPTSNLLYKFFCNLISTASFWITFPLLLMLCLTSSCLCNNSYIPIHIRRKLSTNIVPSSVYSAWYKKTSVNVFKRPG